MTKKHFIALADAIRAHDARVSQAQDDNLFQREHLDVLANFCRAQNPRFNRTRWLAYVNGECGPNGGAIKTRG